MADPQSTTDLPRPPLDAFAELGLRRSASVDEELLLRKFDALSRQHHPDAGGDTQLFARLTEARAILISTARRLRHLLDLEAPGTKLDGPIPSDLMSLFAELGPALHAANDLLATKAGATSGLVRALLAPQEMQLRETLESLAARLDLRLRTVAAAAGSWTGEPAALAALAREAAFLEKWQSQVREILLQTLHRMICGIDLGTTNSLIGVVDAGFPILLADEQGSRLTPSAVYVPPEAGAPPVVGAAALRQRTLHPDRTVTSVKRLMGQRLAVGPGGHSPEDISALILRHLKTQAEAAMGVPITRAVITAPAYFNEAQRSATKHAGELAGFTVERILSEPTAAALAYGLDRLEERSRVAVYDFGGGTFDISVLELRGGVFEVLSTAGDTRLGGDDIDHALLDHLLGEIGHPLPPVARARLWEAAIAAKHALSTEDEHVITLPFIEGSRGFEYQLTRSRLEALARPVIARTLPLSRRALSDAKLTPADLDQVILVGGSTRMPVVRTLVAETFGQEPNVSQDPDEAVALGATIQAGILSGALRHVLLLDVTPLSLGLETFGGLMNVIIPRNTTIPCKAGEMFTNAVANQPSMLIRVLQGEREMARDNWELGQFQIDFAPGPKATAKVGVQFEIDENGLLRVLARDTNTQTDTVLEIHSPVIDVDDARVEAMISQSVEFAFDDMRERVLTEATHKAAELLPAVDQALAQAGDLISGSDRHHIEAAADAVRAALAAGEANRLKAAVTTLDAATEQLAALLVERAMEDSLRRRGVL